MIFEETKLLRFIGGILIWSQDQIKSVWSHTHEEVFFFNKKEKIDKKND
jgi:hypothetical protein